jgi:hypothetical protein
VISHPASSNDTGAAAIEDRNNRGLTPIVPISVTFFTNGPFFIGVNKPMLRTFPAGSNGAQLVALMHELGHLVKNATGTGPLLPIDGGNSTLSQTNTDTMLNYRGKNGKTCKEEIFDAK